MLTEFRNVYEDFFRQKSNVQNRIEINPSPSVIGQNDQNQSNKRINLNSKKYRHKGSNIQHSQETRNREN